MTSKLNLLSLDKYDMEAVVAPAMLSLILIIPSVEVFIDFALVKDVFKEIPSTVLAVVAMLIVFVIWRNIVRIVSKSIFEPIMFGRNSERLPTTLFLLKENSEVDNLLAEKVREKILGYFRGNYFNEYGMDVGSLFQQYDEYYGDLEGDGLDVFNIYLIP